MLGAIGEQLGKKPSASLNPFSKYDFGLPARLQHAKAVHERATRPVWVFRDKMEESRNDSPSDTVNRTRIMICNANDLSPGQKAALETLLGRRVQDGEAVSVRTFEPATVSHERKLEIANELRNYFAEVDAARKPVSEPEAEDIINEAMRSVRPGYRPHQLNSFSTPQSSTNSSAQQSCDIRLREIGFQRGAGF
jgi:hypothetical protein